MLGFGFFQTCIYATKIFCTVWFISSIFMPNDSIEGAEVQEAPCSFSSRAESGVKFHGSQFCMCPKISAKSSIANRSNSIISPLLVGDDGKEKHAAVHSTPVSLF